MGYLHEGHKSLIDKAVSENDHVVVSVFVNPIQFAPTEDLESYPRDLEQDAKLCEAAGASLIFNPEPSDMYSHTFSSFIDMSTLTKGLCGKHVLFISVVFVPLLENSSILSNPIKLTLVKKMLNNWLLSNTWLKI